MNILSSDQVIAINASVIKLTKSFKSDLDETHHLKDRGALESCLGSIFFRGLDGSFLNAPIPKIGGLLLYRIAETQLFENGNKRTAVYSTNLFLKSNGYKLQYTKKEMSDLMWGFAKPMTGESPKYFENDSILFVTNNITIF